jgi:hypothetical protein
MVLKGTVDNNIYQIAQRKLRLDKEVLEVRWHLISCGQLGRGFLAVCLMDSRVEVLYPSFGVGKVASDQETKEPSQSASKIKQVPQRF